MPFDPGMLTAITQGLTQGADAYNVARDAKLKRETEEKQRKQSLAAQGYMEDPLTGELVETPQYLAREKRKFAQEADESDRARKFKTSEREADQQFQTKLAGMKSQEAFKIKGMELQAAKDKEALEQGLATIDPSGRIIYGQKPQGLIAGPGGLTEKQRKGITAESWKAAMFARRMGEGSKILDDLEKSGYSRTDIGPSVRSNIPGILGGRLIETSQDKQQRQAEQNFLTAILRDESGASIGKEEYENAKQVYMPLVGDTPEVLDQKRQARNTAFESLKNQAGLAYTAGGDSGQTIALPSQQKGLVSTSVALKPLDNQEKTRLEFLRKKHGKR